MKAFASATHCTGAVRVIRASSAARRALSSSSGAFFGASSKLQAAGKRRGIPFQGGTHVVFKPWVLGRSPVAVVCKGS